MKVRFEGFETHTRQRPLRPPSDHGPLFFATAWEELRAVMKADGRRLRLLGLSAQALEAGQGDAQAELFGPDRNRQQRLDAAVDAVRRRHGNDRMKRANQPLEGSPRRRPNRTGFSPD